MYGWGLVKGMYVVMKNFVQSYYKDERLTTIQYPEERQELAPRVRCYPFLIYDDDPETLRCVACNLCVKACPVNCISLEMARGPDAKPLKRPADYTVDIAICMSCGLCVESCPFSALAMDHDFERTSPERFEALRLGIPQLRKPYSHLREINPESAEEMKPKPKKTPKPAGTDEGERA